MKIYSRWSDVEKGLKTKRQWSEVGRSINRGSQPSAMIEGKYGPYRLYSEAKTRPKRKRTPKPPQAIDLLQAIFIVTRAAKRSRDAAQTCDEARKAGFASMHRKRQEECYRLKNRGIVEAVHAGLLAPKSLDGKLMYRGGGYCFHSFMRPVGWRPSAEAGEDIRIEAKPKSKKEPRLKDAMFTLEACKIDFSGYVDSRDYQPDSYYEEFDDEQER